MKNYIYSIYDKKSRLFGEPFVSVNDDVAKRRFFYTCGQAKMLAEDLSLYRLGAFEFDSGVITADKAFITDYVSEV